MNTWCTPCFLFPNFFESGFPFLWEEARYIFSLLASLLHIFWFTLSLFFNIILNWFFFFLNFGYHLLISPPGLFMFKHIPKSMCTNNLLLAVIFNFLSIFKFFLSFLLILTLEWIYFFFPRVWLLWFIFFIRLFLIRRYLFGW